MAHKRSKGKTTSISKSGNSRRLLNSQKFYGIVLVGFTILTLIIWITIRYNYLEVPFERDEGTYVYMGKALLEGLKPYIDFYEIKPPGIFYTYATWVLIFGTSIFGIHLGLLVLLAATSLIVFKFTRIIVKESMVAWIALSSFLLFTLNVRLSTFTICSEHFTSFFTIAAAFSFLIAIRSFKKWPMFLAGMLLAWSILIKQTGIFYFPVFLVVIVVQCLHTRQMDWNQLKNYLSPLLLGSMFPFLVMLIMLLIQGSLDEAYYWLIRRPLEYATAVSSENKGEYFRHFISMATRHFEIIWILSGIGIIAYLITKRDISIKILVVGMLFAAILNIIPGGRYYGHYGINLFPYAAFFAGFGIFTIGNRISLLVKKPKSLLNGMTIMLIGLMWTWPIYQYRIWTLAKIPEFLNIVTYGSNPFNEIKYLCDYVNTIKKPGDRMAVIGSEPQAYLYFDELSPTRHIFPAFISNEDAVNVNFQNEASESIEQARPRFIIFVVHPFSWSFSTTEGPSRTFYNWGYFYSQNYYRRVGLAQIYDDRPSSYVFGKEASEVKPNSPYYVEIYERR